MSQHNAFDSEKLSQFVLVFWTGFEPLVMESLDLEADALSIEPPRPTYVNILRYDLMI